MNGPEKVDVAYYTDMLCVWAYVSEIRLSEIKKQFASQINIHYHFLPVFGCTEHRVGGSWKDRGGFKGYSQHVRNVCNDFPHVEIGPDAWNKTIPKSSATSHYFLKAIQILEQKSLISHQNDPRFGDNTLFEEITRRIRQAFFRDGLNIADEGILFDIADQLDIPAQLIDKHMRNGEAMAAMCRDVELCKKYRVDGSPTYILNEGRQKLYGNLGYKIIEANVQEILSRPQNQASWC
jgi:predicted DsbA family dithiol-disulfide isomerase